MTPEQIRLVRQSWQKIAPIADTVATLFYQCLFELDPTLRPLFPADLGAQRGKLMKVFAVRVRRGQGTRRALRQRRRGAPLDQGLGEEFSEELRDAWTAAYKVLAATMRQAARTPLSPAPTG